MPFACGTSAALVLPVGGFGWLWEGAGSLSKDHGRGFCSRAAVQGTEGTDPSHSFTLEPARECPRRRARGDLDGAGAGAPRELAWGVVR